VGWLRPQLLGTASRNLRIAHFFPHVDTAPDSDTSTAYSASQSRTATLAR
jgi:hypothetical protein